ncbi:twitch domain-containing radical SAM protein [bacterium]|nr:twitch domain-containing radical SAM protein [bacterium]
MVYNYNGKEPINIAVDDLTDAQKHLIFENKSFCMYPWLHLHAFPTGEAYPCCNTEMPELVGNTRHNTLEEIWHGTKMQDVRNKMLAGEHVKGCSRCYEQEDNGFFSMRMSANKHFGHHISLTDNPTPPMKMIYWDIRFSNLCNLRCRSCGHIFSSNWYDDQIKLAGQDWAKNNTRINFAGRSEDDIWNQLEPQIDNLEQVYFAGGEPLIMEEHYRLLKELIKRGRHDVRLIYNTNFTQTVYKKTNVFELWREFKSVSVGASLDAMGKHAEYIRKNTVWADVERNREEMLKICPRVDFYISPTLSVMNALHLPIFHRDWVERGFLKPQDLNINILQDPPHYRIDILPFQYKVDIQELYLEHIDWLKPQDHLKRATTGFESAINFMMADDKSKLIPKFIEKTIKLDKIRNENIMEYIPEMRYMYE